MSTLIEEIIEGLKKEFSYVGDEKISGHTAMKMINNVIEQSQSQFKDETGMRWVKASDYKGDRKVLPAKVFSPIQNESFYGTATLKIESNELMSVRYYNGTFEEDFSNVLVLSEPTK